MIDKNEGLKEKFVRKGFWIYFFAFIGWPVGYATKIILSADLGVDEMGVLYGVISLISLVGAYNDLGMTESLNYFLPKFASEKRYAEFKATLLYAVSAQMVSGFLLGVAFFFGADWMGTHYFKHPEAVGVIKVFCLFFMLNNLLQITATLFQIVQNTKFQNFQSFFRLTVTFAFVGTLWLLWHGSLLNYSWAWSVPLVVTVIWAAKMVRRDIWNPYLRWVRAAFSTELLRKVAKYAFLVLLTANVGVVLSQVDMQLIIVLLGTTEAGYYTNYLSLIGIPFLLITPLIGFIFPVISSMTGGADAHKIALIRSFFSKYFAAVAIPVSLVFALFGPDFAIAFFGEKFRKSGEVVAWSAPFLAFNFLLQINFQVLGGTGKVMERLKIILVGLAFNVPLNLALIPAFGIRGSALAVGLSWIPIWYLSHRATSEHRSADFDWAFFLKNLAVGGSVAAGAWWLRHLPAVAEIVDTRISSFLWLSILVLVHIIAFALVNRKESAELLREARTMLAKRKKNA